MGCVWCLQEAITGVLEELHRLVGNRAGAVTGPFSENCWLLDRGPCMSQDSSQEENRYNDFMSNGDLLDWLTQYDLGSP